MKDLTENSSPRLPGDETSPLLEKNLRFFNPWRETAITQNRVPHWQQTGALYFVTFRLVDSIPKEKLDHHYRELKAWKQWHPEPWDEKTELEYHKQFSARIDKWMDAGHGACVLRDRNCAEIVRDAFLHFESERTAMVSFVIMPNHVHLTFVVNPTYDLGQIVQAWKSYTAKRINTALKRDGSVWQKDYFDRMIRDQKHLHNCVKYIRNNPSKSNIPEDEYFLWESELAKNVM